jgi:hypothetical protein
MKNYATAIFVTVLTAAMVSSCSHPNVTIINNSQSELSNVVISGTGFSQTVGNIKIGAKQSILIKPSGESGIALAFDTAGKRHSSKPRGYFESSADKLNVTIAPDFTVDVKNTQ